MSNHFPSVPSMGLANLTYTAAFTTSSPNGNPTDLSAFNATGVTVDSSNYGLFYPGFGGLGHALVLSINFDTPGDAGSFDQDATEELIASTLDSVAQAMADATGTDLATQQALLSVQRAWAWTDGTGFNLTYTDNMTYPA